MFVRPPLYPTLIRVNSIARALLIFTFRYRCYTGINYILITRVYAYTRFNLNTRIIFLRVSKNSPRNSVSRYMYIYIYPGAIRSGRARYPSIGVLVNQAPVRGSNTNRIEYRYLVSEFLKHLINLSIRGEIVLLDVSIHSILPSILLILHQQ